LADNSRRQRRLSIGKGLEVSAKDRPGSGQGYHPLEFDLNGVLQPKQVTVLTANFIRPPIDGVAIWIVLV
jgi:hypothetical protein